MCILYAHELVLRAAILLSLYSLIYLDPFDLLKYRPFSNSRFSTRVPTGVVESCYCVLGFQNSHKYFKRSGVKKRREGQFKENLISGLDVKSIIYLSIYLSISVCKYVYMYHSLCICQSFCLSEVRIVGV